MIISDSWVICRVKSSVFGIGGKRRIPNAEGRGVKWKMQRFEGTREVRLHSVMGLSFRDPLNLRERWRFRDGGEISGLSFMPSTAIEADARKDQMA